MTKQTLLQKVRAKLQGMERKAVFATAIGAKVSPDLALRIRAGHDSDPGFAKVQALADQLGLK